MISVVMEMAGVPSRRRGMPLVASILASLVLSAGVRGSAGAFGGKANPELPLAVRVYRVFHLPAGSHPWLPALAKLIAALPHARRWTPHDYLSAVRDLREHDLADARAVVNALNDGANPVALRDKLLGSLDLNYRHVLPKGEKWLYGNFIERQLVAYLFMREGGYLALHGHKKRARRWLRAALLLSCQDDIRLPWENILSRWVRAPLVQGSSDWNANMRTVYGIFLAALAGPSEQRRLDDLYRLAMRMGGGSFSRYYDAVSGPEITDKTQISPVAADAMLRHLRAAISGVPSTYWRFALLRSVLSLRGQLNLHGYRGLSEKIKQVLQQWAVKIKADRAMPKLERNALLRWIKEASI